jgi:serine/threonine protein phosphatase PrpC
MPMVTQPVAIGDPGRAAIELAAGRPPAIVTNADHEISECSIDGVEVRAASIRGLMHRYREEPRQDRFAISYDAPNDMLLIAVCDGVGSLGQSHEAADLASKAAVRSYAETRNWPDSVAEVNFALTALAEEAAREAFTESDAQLLGMKTTLVGAAIELSSTPPTASLVWTDDSVVWGLSDGTWTILSTSDDPTDPVLHTGSVRALPHREPRFQQASLSLDSITAIFVMTDGVGVPLEQSSEVQETLARWWSEPPDVFTFGQQVGFARKSHIDDRTVVGIWFPKDEADSQNHVSPPMGLSGSSR